MPIDVTVEDHIALITINRPERMNALDNAHYRALSEAWVRVRDDGNIRSAIVTGAGDRAFCAGADIKSLLPQPTALSDMWLTQKDQIINRGLEVWKPIIAAVNGVCMGGGTCMLFATDIRIAATHATFNLAEVKRGVVAANGGTQRLISQVPYAIAMEILLVGDTFDTTMAERWGLINKVVPMADLLPTAYAYAKRIAANAPLAVQAAKELAIRSRDMDLQTGLRWERMVTRMLQGTEDVAEGAKAFAEKRPPQFKGR